MKSTDEGLIGFADGILTVEGIAAEEIARRFGTPLYVTSEMQIRQNYRTLHAAFASRYPDVTLLYANKANNNVAVRHILTQEGGGGDCFGLGELTFALDCGVSPDKLVLNGSNKGRPEIELAIVSGVTINVDHPDEIGLVESVAAGLGRTALVNLRILPFSFADPSALPPDLALIAADTSHDKWGMRPAEVRTAAAAALASRNLELRGLHMHVSRITATTAPFELATRMLAQCAAELRQRFGWQPSVVDIGGGYAHQRDPESGQEVGTHAVATADAYAQAITGALKSEFGRLGLKLPSLWLEPGRHLVSNSTLLLTRVGQVKRDPDGSLSWVHIDASANHCLRVPLQNYHYRITLARQHAHGPTMLANVTGPTCTMDLIAERRTIPAVEAGDLVAVWDVGGYAEVMATQFNLIPRPATVLVSGDHAEPIRRREELADIMRTQIVPKRLRRVARAGNFLSGQMQQGGTQS